MVLQTLPTTLAGKVLPTLPAMLGAGSVFSSRFLRSFHTSKVARLRQTGSVADLNYGNGNLHAFDKDLRVPPKSIKSAHEAVEEFVKSGDRIYVHMAAAAPLKLLEGLTDLADNYEHIELYHLHLEGPEYHTDPKFARKFRAKCMFCDAKSRRAVNEGRADFIPIFFSEIPALFRKKRVPLDVAFIQVSPPDKHGFCSMGVSVDCSLAAVQTARYVIGQINPNMPRTHGDGIIHVNSLDAVVEVDDPLGSASPKDLSEEERKIGEHIAALIPDRACLQMGIGNIPDAVLRQLGGHKDLGVHTEMFADGVIDLVEKGVVTNKFKTVMPGKLLATFLVGSKRLYDFVDDNHIVDMRDVSFVNNPLHIMQNPKMHAINSAIEIDLTGQVCADSIGMKHFSGIGGQMDFIRGAALSEGGKPIIAMPATTAKGESKIVPTLKPGAGVVTTRAHVHYVVTEFGVVNLHGLSTRERAKALISISHPDHREALEKAAFERFGKW